MSIVHVMLTNGRKPTANSFKIDKEDLKKVIGYNWSIHKGYVRRRFLLNGAINSRQSVHRLVLGLKHGDGIVVDHKNGDKLDNRKCNLRICTRTENALNRKGKYNSKTGIKGVCFVKSIGKYRAMIQNKGTQFFLGYFKNIEDAAKVYKEKSLELEGEFSFFNRPTN